jgi:hypothetical protein
LKLEPTVPANFAGTLSAAQGGAGKKQTKHASTAAARRPLWGLQNIGTVNKELPCYRSNLEQCA